MLSTIVVKYFLEGGRERTLGTRLPLLTEVFINTCLHRIYTSDGQSASLTKNSGKEPGRSPSLTLSRVETGDGVDIPFSQSKQASPTKPRTGTHRGHGGEEDHV